MVGTNSAVAIAFAYLKLQAFEPLVSGETTAWQSIWMFSLGCLRAIYEVKLEREFNPKASPNSKRDRFCMVAIKRSLVYSILFEINADPQ